MDVLARCAGVSEEAFRELNPMLLRGVTPPDGSTWVNLPPGTAETFAANLQAIPPDRRVTWRHHVVRRGETLSAIARRYGVSTSSIVRANHLRNPNRIVVGTRLVIPVAGVTPPPPAARAAADGSGKRAGGGAATSGKRVHEVRRGETLSEIAGAYGVRTEDLLAWNGIEDPRRIQPGQRLVVQGDGSPGGRATAAPAHRGARSE